MTNRIRSNNIELCRWNTKGSLDIGHDLILLMFMYVTFLRSRVQFLEFNDDLDSIF